jgi:hypothetical protein
MYGSPQCASAHVAKLYGSQQCVPSHVTTMYGSPQCAAHVAKLHCFNPFMYAYFYFVTALEGLHYERI